MPKKRLVLLSDLWGTLKETTLQDYKRVLAPDFEVLAYDSRELGGLKPGLSDQGELHRQFVTGGIAKAVENLLEREQKMDVLVGLSVGGTIGWKALLQGLEASRFYAISATRLRLESQKPRIPVHLLYGAEDKFKPNPRWFSDLEIEPEFISRAQHEVYAEKEFINRFAKRLRTDFGFYTP